MYVKCCTGRKQEVWSVIISTGWSRHSEMGFIAKCTLFHQHKPMCLFFKLNFAATGLWLFLIYVCIIAFRSWTKKAMVRSPQRSWRGTSSTTLRTITSSTWRRYLRAIVASKALESHVPLEPRRMNCENLGWERWGSVTALFFIIKISFNLAAWYCTKISSATVSFQSSPNVNELSLREQCIQRLNKALRSVRYSVYIQ